MFGRSFGVLVVLAVLTLSAISLGATYSGGDGSANSPYLISSVADWKVLMNPANSADWSKTFKLTKDIDFKGAEITPIGPDANDSSAGFQGTAFSGLLDGQNFRLLNAVINQPAKNYVGVFGNISTGGRVCNLGVENIHVLGRGIVGGLAGMSFGDITFCHVKGVIRGEGSIGGLAGKAEGGIIQYCYSEIHVEGTGAVGGLFGYHARSTVRYCYSQGTVKGNDCVGGLEGINSLMYLTDASLFNCYSTCQVTGVNCVGGFIGRLDGCRLIVSCYSAGLVSGTTYTGGFIGQNNSVKDTISWLNYSCKILSCFWDIQSSGQTESAGGTGKTTAQMQDVNTYDKQEWDFTTTDSDPAVWFMDEGGYPALAFQKQMIMPNVAGIPFSEAGELLSTNDVGLHFTIGLEYSDTATEDVVVSQMPAAGTPVRGNSTVHIVLSCPTSGYSDGDGSSSNPYRIGSVSGWIHLSQSPTDWKKSFILTSDIDFKGASIIPIAENQNISTNSFSGTYFSGVMDGRCFTLRNATINQESRYCVGLFGKVDGGQRAKILNLSLQQIHVLGRWNTGGLAGSMNSGSVINCRIDGTVDGGYATGGLVGSLGIDTFLKDSFAAGRVRGTSYVGGVAGMASGELSCCYSTNTVSGMNWVGGLSGRSIQIKNCYSISSVVGDAYVGGLCGQIEGSLYTLYNSYAAGAVSGVAYVGGLTGDVGTTGSVTGSFWDMEATGQAESQSGSGKTTAQMRSRSTFIDAGWDFKNVWAICEGSNYPRLRLRIMPADRVCPDGVNTEDLGYMMQHWMLTHCTASNGFCDGADMDESGAVDITDFAILAEQWLEVNTYSMLPAVPASVAWWKMDETEGTEIIDSMGGHHGQLINSTGNLLESHYEGKLRLDGENDYVDISGYKGICGTAYRTCAARIYLNDFNQEQVIMSWGSNAAGQKWIFRVGADNKLAVDVGGGYVQTKDTIFGKGWYHVAAVLIDDGSPSVDEIILYVNGIPQATTHSSTQPINTVEGQNVQIGSFYTGTSQTGFYCGLIDDVQIFDRALIIHHLYQLGGQW